MMHTHMQNSRALTYLDNLHLVSRRRAVYDRNRVDDVGKLFIGHSVNHIA